MADIKIGKVTHYYDKIGVAVVELADTLKVGDKVRFVRGGEDLFEQTIDSMQFDHKAVEQAKAGEEIGLKVNQEVKDSADVYKID